MKSKEIIFTVDVEDWYQVENLKGAIPKNDWAKQSSRVVDNTLKILDLLGRVQGKATFFILGLVARQHRSLVSEIFRRGHEVASHGFGHELVYNQTPVEFKDDVCQAKALLEDITGRPVLGYRAPSFSITDWAIDVLAECGYKYDSSLFSFAGHQRYGKLSKLPHKKPGGQYRYDNGLAEIPLSMLALGSMNIPWAGGGYFRCMPYFFYRQGIKAIKEKGDRFAFYIHPWEIDPNQPKIKGIRAGYKLRHYINLRNTYNKLCLLAGDFKPCSVEDVLV